MSSSKKGSLDENETHQDKNQALKEEDMSEESNSIKNNRVLNLQMNFRKQSSNSSNSSSSSRGRLIRQEAFDLGDEDVFGGGDPLIDMNNNIIDEPHDGQLHDNLHEEPR